MEGNGWLEWTMEWNGMEWGGGGGVQEWNGRNGLRPGTEWNVSQILEPLAPRNYRNASLPCWPWTWTASDLLGTGLPDGDHHYTVTANDKARR